MEEDDDAMIIIVAEDDGNPLNNGDLKVKEEILDSDVKMDYEKLLQLAEESSGQVFKVFVIV